MTDDLSFSWSVSARRATMAASDGPAVSALDGIRERWSKVAYVGLKPEVVPEPGHQAPWLPDVARLLKAVEAALKLADGATVLLSACGVSGRCSCGTHPVAWNLDPPSSGRPSRRHWPGRRLAMEAEPDLTAELDAAAEPNWLRRFVVANLNLWERGDRRGAAVADIAMATDIAPGDITAELELMQAEGLARCSDDGRWHPGVPDVP